MWNSEPQHKKRKEPFQVFLATYTAVKVGEIEPWIHYTRVQKAPPPDQWRITSEGPLKVKINRVT